MVNMTMLSETKEFFSAPPSEMGKVLVPLALFMVGVAIYALFVFKFYRFVAHRDVFKLNLRDHNTLDHPFFHAVYASVLYTAEYLLFFPLLTFFWFLVMTAFLIFLAKEQPIENTLLVSMALVGAIRITAYFSEDLSKDLAKMLPFALLGIFLVDISFFNLSESLSAVYALPTHAPIILLYLVFVILLELILRILFGIVKMFKKEEELEQ